MLQSHLLPCKCGMAGTVIVWLTHQIPLCLYLHAWQRPSVLNHEGLSSLINSSYFFVCVLHAHTYASTFIHTRTHTQIMSCFSTRCNSKSQPMKAGWLSGFKLYLLCPLSPQEDNHWMSTLVLAMQFFPVRPLHCSCPFI